MATAGLLVVALLAPPGVLGGAPTWTVTDLATGRAVLCRPAAAPLRLHFTHSMYGGEVIEEYVAAGTSSAGLTRVGMWADRAGAAEYYATDGAVAADPAAGGRFRILAAPATFPEVVVRVDRIGDQRVSSSGPVVHLLDRVAERGRVRIAVELLTPLGRYVGGC